MDCWIVALRGVEDALVEARAVFGPPVAWLGSIEIFQFETADPATAAQAIARIAESRDEVSGAVVLEGDDPNGGRERAVALACAAAPREVLFDAATRARLERELLFVHPETREGWQLPLVSVALAPSPARRADCRDAVAEIAGEPKLVARERPVAALLAASQLETGGPILVRADVGMGGGRVIEEAAKRAGKTAWRVPRSALEDADGLWRAISAVKGDEWIVVDPVTTGSAPLMPRLASRLTDSSHQLILRAAEGIDLSFVPAERTITLPEIREYDARAIVQSMLGAETSEAIVARLAKRAEGSPRRLVETVRGAIQSGEIKHEGTAWVRRDRRALAIQGAPTDPVAARVADLPPLLGRAMAVMAAVGDGAREIEVRAALRGTITPSPDQCIAPIAALGLIEIHDGRIGVSSSVCALFPGEHHGVLSLLRAGSLESAARGEALLRAGKLRDAGDLFAQAATSALAANLRVAAVRYLAAAVPSGTRADALSSEVAAVMPLVAAAISPAVVIETLNASGAVVGRARALDPAALEQTAAQLEERKDVDGAARLRALAELLRGNSKRALRLTDHLSSEPSSKAQLVAALAQASAGDLHRAIRSALTALVMARRTSAPSGEMAALALLSSFYRAAGRDDEAKSLADGARKFQPADPAA